MHISVKIWNGPEAWSFRLALENIKFRTNQHSSVNTYVLFHFILMNCLSALKRLSVCSHRYHSKLCVLNHKSFNLHLYCKCTYSKWLLVNTITYRQHIHWSLESNGKGRKNVTEKKSLTFPNWHVWTNDAEWIHISNKCNRKWKKGLIFEWISSSLLWCEGGCNTQNTLAICNDIQMMLISFNRFNTV